MRKFRLFLLAGSAATVAAAGLLSLSAAPSWADPELSGDHGNIPPGLIISGEKGRVDNGVGNGGENTTSGNTPNRNGENGGQDDDPEHSEGHANSDKNDGRPNSPASRGNADVDGGI